VQVIILGDGSVGKTSLAMRYTRDHFSATYKQTIGLDFFIKRLELPGARLLCWLVCSSRRARRSSRPLVVRRRWR
jgi:GTPase SAR1 family protein